MKLGYEITIEQQQKLVMTPELLQAIQILQYNSHELEAFVKEELIKNPVLEQENNREEKESFTREDAIGQFIGEYGGHMKSGGSYNKNSDAENDYEGYVTSETTLYGYLLFQLQFACKGKEETEIGKFIIESLDENGYMTLTVEEIAEEMNCDVDVVLDTLDKIQQFDPAGIAAVSLSDCLKRQLMSKGLLSETADIILSEYLESLAENKLQHIAKRTGTDIKKVQETADVIKSLDPKPGSGFGDNQKVTYIVPDVILEKNERGDYEIVMNNFSTPSLMVSSYYEKLYKDSKSDEIVKMYLAEKMESAIRLIRSIEQRKHTIVNVTQSIVKYQREFFEKGDKYLKTMTLKQIADELDIHESTVSRAINGKYIQCQRGVYELKFFFSAGVSASDGENISSNSIKTYLKEIIAKEDEKVPYSDQKLVELLKEKGFNISRRTVAKYRDEMNIPSSSKRKRY